MGVPSTRTPVRVARGTYANLTTTNALAALQDGEIAYATDTNTAYVVETESGTKALRPVTGIATSDLVDEDNMASDSATKVPSQQSVKAYVDTQVATKQASDAELTELATMASGTAGALADLLQAEVEILDGATVTTAELNLLDGVTATTTELNYVDGVTSAIQTQLNAKGVGDATLAGDNTWTGSQRGEVSDVGTKTSAFDFDLDTSNNFKITINGTFELGFTNIDAGQSGTIEVVNGAFTPSYGSEIHFVGGTVPSLTQSATSFLAYYCPSDTVVFVQHMLNVKQGGT